MDLKAMIESSGIDALAQELSEKLGKVNKDYLLQLTVGSHEHGEQLEKERLLTNAPDEGYFGNASWWKFQKAGDGFADIRFPDEAPEPPPENPFNDAFSDGIKF